MKSKTRIFVFAAALMLAILPSVSFAMDGAPMLPKSLFDVELGGIYKIGKARTPSDVGSLPVRRFTAIHRYMGSGLHYFFQPLKSHQDFKYVERRNSAEEEYYESSFRLYLLPVVHQSVTLTKNMSWDWSVMLIEWSSHVDKQEEAYRWAVNMCKSAKKDLKGVPVVRNDPKAKEYSCTFREGVNKLEIKATAMTKFYKLSRTQLALNETNDAVDGAFRKIKMKELAARKSYR